MLEAEPAPPIAEYDPTTPLPAADAAGPSGEIDTGAENGMIGLLAAALAGLIPIGLAVAAVVWWRRRSRPVAAAPQPTVVVRREPPTPADVKPATPAREPIFTREETRRPFETTAAEPAAPAASGGVALAERTQTESDTSVKPRYDEPEVPADDVSGPVPEDSAARSRLIERMVDAEPDDANPFTTRKARRRRARLILASRAQGNRGRMGGTTGGNWLSQGGFRASPA